MQQLLARLRSDESGATAIEYGLLAALISVVIISALFGVGQALGGLSSDGVAARVATAIGYALSG